MGKNAEVVRALYGAFNERDQETSRRLLADDVEWVNPESAVEPGKREGREQYDEALRSLRRAFKEVEIEVEEIVESGDRVATTVVFHAGTRGLTTDDRQGHLWTLRDGRAVRFEWFRGEGGPGQALEALGAD